MTRGVKRFTDLRAWQACDVFKKAVYRLCDNKPIANDVGRRKQMEESSSRQTAHIAARTTNAEPRTTNPEPNAEPRTQYRTMKLNTNREPRTQKG